MRRVAVTGFGVVSPVGLGREAFWDALQEGRSGIAPISRFEVSSFDVQLAGEALAALDLPAEVARVAAEDLKVGFAWAACAEALADAGLERLGATALLHLATSLESFDLEKVISGGRADFHGAVERSLAPGARPLQIPLSSATELIDAHFGPAGRAL
ncbi:MAG: beta-ketoacyl synthase N-terminal-like domain-containing protein, partial [Planctomycetota bacterium]